MQVRPRQHPVLGQPYACARFAIPGLIPARVNRPALLISPHRLNLIEVRHGEVRLTAYRVDFGGL
jgi:hypothetical protein